MAINVHLTATICWALCGTGGRMEAKGQRAPGFQMLTAGVEGHLQGH